MTSAKFDLSLLPQAPDLSFESELWASGLQHIAGIDEAGRGALAGPVVAGAVVLPNLPDLQQQLEGVRDSKQMTPDDRQHWAGVIRGVALFAEVGSASAAEVDEVGIIAATRLAVVRALAALAQRPEHLLIDHLSVPEARLPETILTKGDCRSLSIAAASVLAKVSRDEVMCQFDADHPEYGFAEHKGYGTVWHRAVLEELGPCVIHRMSFAPLRQEEDLQPPLL